jgi:preprotein translocase subunit SecG
MENVVLTIHLILALALIGIVLLQRSEGGALGMGGGGGSMAARSQATGLTKLTWVLAACFIVTSLTLTILATRGSGAGSVVDSVATEAPAPATETPASPGLSGDLLPPSATDAPATAPRADEPAAPATNP